MCYVEWVSPYSLPSLHFFLSIAIQFNHTCPTTQNEENNLRNRPRNKETPKKALGKIMSSNYKNV